MHGELKLTRYQDPPQVPNNEVMEHLKKINLELRAVGNSIGELLNMQSIMRKTKEQDWAALYNGLLDDIIKAAQHTESFYYCEHHYNERDWNDGTRS